MHWSNMSDGEKSDWLLDLVVALTIVGGLIFFFLLLVAALLFAPWPIKVVVPFLMVFEGLIVASLWYGTRPPH